ncbi:hypothetical protein [Ramlibacter tataouinensis]|uniref:Uncharacterized protein n=1 Tax=Ramlibacter tataouinensis (strain ATCC BAA-407 / DSM 14655 / LMG 21543 / TTB310) TaxID=365046 RepID=F5XWL3_RAMTT|nr:hypothetical protein [Ramlibacter tataouinensis]AEG94157.1 conserved hypothetical protein [Ramlibacter tataouinensis TTB310]
MKQIYLSALLLSFASVTLAKLPPQDDATKAKAAETAARQAWQAKVDAFQLCRAQDRIASRYRKAGAMVPVSTGGTAPAAAAGCPDPGPFAYNAPAQKPLETSGAHSPTGTAASPPSVKPSSAEMAPAKKP